MNEQETIRFILENSSEPVIKNPVMRAALQEPRTMAQEPRNMAHGGRTGFYKGESAVKSHGDKIIQLGEAGESGASIAKKLKLKQQTVSNAINSIEKGLAGKKYKFSKPFQDIAKSKINLNQWIMSSDQEIKNIVDNPKYKGWSKKSFTNEKILTRGEVTRLEELGFKFTPGKGGMPKKELENVFELLHDAEIKAFKKGDLSEDRIRQLYASRRNQKNFRMPFPKNAHDALYNDFYLGSEHKNSRYKVVEGTGFGNKKYPNIADLRKVKFKDTLTDKILSYDGIEKFDFKQTVMKNGKMTFGKSMPYDDVISAYEFKINLNQHPEIKTKINQSYVKGWDEMPNHIKARSGQAYSVQHNLAKHLDPANTSFSFFDQNKNEYHIKKDFLDDFNKKLPYSKKKALYQTYKTRLAADAPDVVSTFGKHTTGTAMDAETFLKKSGVKNTKDIKSFKEVVNNSKKGGALLTNNILSKGNFKPKCKTKFANGGGGLCGKAFAEADPQAYLDEVMKDLKATKYLQSKEALTVGRSFLSKVAKVGSWANPLTLVGGEAWYSVLAGYNEWGKGASLGEAVNEGLWFIPGKHSRDLDILLGKDKVTKEGRNLPAISKGDRNQFDLLTQLGDLINEEGALSGQLFMQQLETGRLEDVKAKSLWEERFDPEKAFATEKSAEDIKLDYENMKGDIQWSKDIITPQIEERHKNVMTEGEGVVKKWQTADPEGQSYPELQDKIKDFIVNKYNKGKGWERADPYSGSVWNAIKRGWQGPQHLLGFQLRDEPGLWEKQKQLDALKITGQLEDQPITKENIPPELIENFLTKFPEYSYIFEGAEGGIASLMKKK